MLKIFKGLSVKEWALIFLVFLVASSLRFLAVPFTSISPVADQLRAMSAILSTIHLLEFFCIERLWRVGKFPVLWVIFCFNPISLYLLNQTGQSFWIFEGAALSLLLLKGGFKKLGILTALFTVALVFL